MSITFDPVIRMIPVQQIHIMNPRARGKKKFDQIVSNIGTLGLKKPVTVTHVEGTNGDARYDLVCGQGRLEAYIQLGQELIPAILVKGTREDLLMMSLAENLARRSHSTIEMVRAINLLKEAGYKHQEIAQKIDLDATYVGGVLKLLARGEERLLQAVEKGQLPISIAITIATTDDKSVQRALQDAYEKHDLRGRSLMRARRLIECRRTRGKCPRGGPRQPAEKVTSTESLLKTFQQETIRQKMVVQKAKICETRLMFAVSALKQLFQDTHFVTLLRAEGLNSLPQYLAERIDESEDQS